MIQNNIWELCIDGASKGNPGEAGIGVIIRNSDTVKKTLSEYIGITTNNVAEYSALIFGLQEALIQNIRTIHIKTDSELLYKQITGEYKVKDDCLQLLHKIAKHMLSGFAEVDITNVPRENNRDADRLANEAVQKRPVLLRKTKKLKASQDDQLPGLAEQ